MAKETIINLDPIDRKKKKGFIGRLLVTRYSGGKPVLKSDPFGHYMFCGPQGSGKFASLLWYGSHLRKRYKCRKLKYIDEVTGNYVKFKTPPLVKFYSNMGIGDDFDKTQIFDLIDKFDPYANEVRIVFIDEIQAYFPKGSIDKQTKLIQADLVAIFSQLRKRNTYILSTAQVYGRLDKSLREQCLYMVNNRVNYKGKIVSEFIKGDDIICDDLGRWAGDPAFIYVHGLSDLKYDTKKVIRA